MVMILLALIVFAVILAIGYPIVNASQYQLETTSNGDDRYAILMSQRNSVFDAIRDLEFDHQTGKLSDQDYKQMRAKYDLKAAEVLQKMDALAAAQNKRGNGKGSTKANGKSACPKCNAPVLANDRFCPKCGNKLG